MTGPPRRTAAEAYDRSEAFRRRRPRLVDDLVTLAHGAGGSASAALVDTVFVEAFGNPWLDPLGDGAVLPVPDGTAWLAFTTDSYVVTPLRFPGGSIGHLAVHGTVNDLAMCGALPQWISAAFVLEEGLEIEVLRGIVADLAEAARSAGVAVVTGDTKVVPKGAADGMFVTTSGLGVVPAERRLGPDRVRPGDRLLVSGTLGRHGMAVLLARGDLAIAADICSDTAPLTGPVQDLLAAAPDTRWLRDATRGGLGTVANELARSCGLGVVFDEAAIPVLDPVRGACDLLGIDPLYVANEGVFLAVVPAEQAEAALAAVRAHPLGADAALVGDVTTEQPGLVVMRTVFGGSRMVDMLVGDPLPRIC